MRIPRPGIQSPTKRGDHDREVYERLASMAQALKVQLSFAKIAPFIVPVPKNTAWFYRNRAGRKVIEFTPSYTTHASLVSSMAHELGHALACTVDTVPYTDIDEWVKDHPVEAIIEEETAWALADLVTDEMGYQRSPYWNQMKENALVTYYRFHFKDGALLLQDGRERLGIDVKAITDRAKHIRQHPKVTKLLPMG